MCVCWDWLDGLRLHRINRAIEYISLLILLIESRFECTRHCSTFEFQIVSLVLDQAGR